MFFLFRLPKNRFIRAKWVYDGLDSFAISLDYPQKGRLPLGNGGHFIGRNKKGCTFEVVCQVHATYFSFSSVLANGSDRYATHEAGNVAKDVFNS